MRVMYIHVWLTNLLGAYADYVWVLHGLITFFVASMLHWLQNKGFKHLLARAQKTPYVWDDAFVQALSAPFTVLIWLFAIALFSEYTLSDFGYTQWSLAMMRVRTAGASLILLWFVWRFIAQMEFRLIKPGHSRKPMDASTVFVVGRFARIALFVIGILVLLDNLGIPVTGLLAFGGGGAIVMGIAAQQLLANWFGGLMIFLDKPFALGDWIQSPDRHIEGKVTHIGWRTTAVMSLENRPLYIPNALFNQIVIVNPQRMTHRKINAIIGLRYEDAAVLKNIVAAISDMLRHHPHVSRSEAITVNFVKFSASSLDVNFTCFVAPVTEWQDFQQEIFFKVIDIVAEQKAEFAFPTVTNHIPQGISIRQGDSCS